MNTKSLICDYIHNHPNTWQNNFQNLGIKVNTENSLAIFNYGEFEADFTNPLIQEARGIIIDLNTLNVLCWPFRKFGNWNESYADQIDWNTARVQEKIDGSIVKLWWNPFDNTWTWSSNSVIHAKNASIPFPTETVRTYEDAIKIADNYDQIMNAPLNRDFTYIFEITSPMNEVVIHHTTIHLWHIGTRHNTLGTEHNINIGISRPTEYPLHTFQECMTALEKLNTTQGIVTQEGYVVVDDNWHRIKIKSPAYLAVHHLLGNGIVSKEKAFDIITHNLVNEIRPYPQTYAIIKWYEYQLAEFELTVANYMAYARGLFNEVNQDRKALATAIKHDALSDYGFRAIGNNYTAADLIAKATPKNILKFLKEYKK